MKMIETVMEAAAIFCPGLEPCSICIAGVKALAAAGLLATAIEERRLDDGVGSTSGLNRPQTRQQRGVTEWRTV